MNTLALISRLWQEAQDVPALMEDFVAGRGKLIALQNSQKEHLLDMLWDHLDHGIILPSVFLQRVACRQVIVEDPEFAEYYSRSHLE